jgi:hypothetical protein
LQVAGHDVNLDMLPVVQKSKPRKDRGKSGAEGGMKMGVLAERPAAAMRIANCWYRIPLAISH